MYRIYRLICIFILLMTMFVLPTMQVSAALARCRTDPIFKLSNGDILTVTLDIGTDAANVKNVIYTLHVPPGVRVTQVIYTAGGIGRKEVYKVYQDSAAKTYIADTVLTTQNAGGVPVTVYARLNGVLTKSASGYNGQHLIITLSKP